jgi:ankyrin repeat protein
MVSAINGYLDIVKYLAEKSEDIQSQYNSALKYSAKYGHLNVVKYLLEHGADIHANNDSALRYSIEEGRLHTVKYLVEQGANIYADNDYALINSADNKYLEIVEYLIVDCNMTIKQETLKYLEEEQYLDIIHLINCRDLNNQLNKNLSSNIIDNKTKVKI